MYCMRVHYTVGGFYLISVLCVYNILPHSKLILSYSKFVSTLLNICTK